MSKSQILVLIISIVAVIILIQLPKAIVKNEDKTLNTTENKQESNQMEEIHTDSLSKEQTSLVSFYKKRLKESKNISDKAAYSDSLYSFYRSVQFFDSAAIYKSNIAELNPSIQNWMLAGDAYLDAFKFSLDPEKANAMGAKARSFYEKVIEKEPKFFDARTKMGMTYMTSKNPMQGIQMLRDVLVEDPKNEFAILNLGLFSIQSKQYDKAVVRFQDLLKINPKNEEAQLYLSESLLNVGDKQKALETLRNLIKTGKDSLVVQAAKEFEKQIQ